jgi:hypothetical protein
MALPTREPKRVSANDKKWPYSFACELDAIPPSALRGMVHSAIEAHMPPDRYRVLQAIEENERSQLSIFGHELVQRIGQPIGPTKLWNLSMNAFGRLDRDTRHDFARALADGGWGARP